jgi:LysR family cys regulon transcriptional activator
MNFQQLRIIRETVRCNFNLTEVANKLYTSQSGVSKHIKDLEDELGIELFERKGKRLLGMTAPGRELAKIVDRILLDAQNIKNLAEQYSQQDQGQLTIATTHTQARYVLPTIVALFRHCICTRAARRRLHICCWRVRPISASPLKPSALLKA